MNKLLKRRLLVAAVSLSLLSNTPNLRAEESTCCPGPGTVLAFFNGVLTTERAAADTLKELKKIHGELDGTGQKLQYEIMYNYTNGFEDFVETFQQRMHQHDTILAGRFELFFSTLRGSSDGTWWSAIINTLGGPAKELQAAIFDTIRAKMIGTLLSLFRTPPTELNYAEHRSRIDSFIAEGKKLLFVSHSQGNLFVVPGYDYAVSKTRLSAIRVVHIAPASPTLRGTHILADLDLVINGLRPLGTVASITHFIPGYIDRAPDINGNRDLLGHGMTEIYINQKLEIAKGVKNAINTALGELIAPT